MNTSAGADGFIAYVKQMVTSAQPFLPLIVLLLAGGTGGGVRCSLDARIPASRRKLLPFVLLGASASCLAYTLGNRMFPGMENPNLFYAALVGIGTPAGLFGLELAFATVRRIGVKDYDSAIMLDKRDIGKSLQQLAKDPAAQEIRRSFPWLEPFYQDLEK